MGIIFLFFSLLILTLGIISDLKLMKSAKKRLIFQFIIVLIFVISNDIQIVNTRVDLLEKLISNNYINYIFVCFCVLIVINGSNFFDGLNTYKYRLLFINNINNDLSKFNECCSFSIFISR